MAGDIAAGRKVRPRYELHHFFERRVGFLDHEHRGVNDFAQVVRRNVRGHADGDAASAVDEKIRNPRGKNERLFLRFVEVGSEIDGFFFNISQQFLGDARQTRFGVAHRRRHVAVDRPEIALAVHQRIAHVEVLRHAHQCVVDGRVAMRVILAEDFADDLRAFAVRARGRQPQLVHAVENAPVHGLQAVAHFGQRAADDYAHRVVEIGLLHLGFDVHRNHHRQILFVWHVPSCFVWCRLAPGLPASPGFNLAAPP